DRHSPPLPPRRSSDLVERAREPAQQQLERGQVVRRGQVADPEPRREDLQVAQVRVLQVARRLAAEERLSQVLQHAPAQEPLKARSEEHTSELQSRFDL